MRLGSPPPMRGKARRTIYAVACAGITPAHAGKSAFCEASSSRSQDHPRPCGEKALVLLSGRRRLGSPPPMRGKAGGGQDRRGKRGITPAHAGKSTPHSSQRACGKDHPRPCGEKATDRLIDRKYVGSPPPMRGKAAYARGQTARVRITPAHAGKRSGTSRRHLIIQDHPRPCGEKFLG